MDHEYEKLIKDPKDELAESEERSLEDNIDEKEIEYKKNEADGSDAEAEEKEEVEEEEIQDKKDQGKDFKESIKGFLKRHITIIKSISIALTVLIIIYLGISIYFIDHFYFGTKINDVMVSGKSIEEAEKVMESELEKYTLILKERGGKTEQIKARDMGLKYSSNKEIEKLKQSQNPYKWAVILFNKKSLEHRIGFSFNKNLLMKKIDQLSCFDDDRVSQPQNPRLKYNGNNFAVIPEVQGNKVDKDILYKHIVSAIKNSEEEIDLESMNCYIKPKYNSNSKKVIKAQETLNLYVASKIIYSFGAGEERLDGSIINKWMIVDDNYKVTIDEEKVKEYVNQLAKAHNTIGKTRSLKTPSGKSIKVSGGDYGRSINKINEMEELMKDIKKGKTITRKPVYSQSAFSHGSNDIGDTFVEIDLVKQHIWFYKNGSLIVDGDIVTGNVSRKHTTPKGVYRLKYKAKNVVLRGPDYASPVSFWMPFNGGIGMHDANWRSSFGGTIYKTNGSHGCINCPYDVAKAIYSNIEPNIPVICH